jgi:YidC/Oxa1 family membrane protein insertase
MFLIEFLRYILEFFYGLTNSFGLSIVLLSLAVTIIMLPLFWIAEIIQNKERARKATMQPSLDEIKDVKNKREKYYYTKEIYRKYKYSPFYSLTGLLGLLIQVPFFLAAYWMLFEYLPLEGVSFGLIKDLFQPDGLISFGGMTFNLLPFVMTIVNLFASYLYTKNKDKIEQRQLVAVALVFLVLLYNLSAALVLYWTMNNIFAIGKNWLMSNIKSKNIENFLSKYLSKLKKILYTLLKKNGYIRYPLLFSTFPLLSIYFTNIGELYFRQIVSLLILILFSTLILLVIAKAVFRDKNKAVLFGVLMLILFFSFGHIVELFMGSNIVYRELMIKLIGTYMVLFFLISYFLYKSKRNLEKIARVFNVLSVCLFSIIVIRIVSYNISINDHELTLNTSNDIQVENNDDLNKNDKQYPDIYYLVLDGYANSGILKDVHNFDNSSFDNALEERGFYLAKDSRSNYLMTFLSLAATLNMDYINYLKDIVGVDSKERSLTSQMISDNKVIKYLKNKGYKTVHFSSGWGVTNISRMSDYNFSKPNRIGEFSTTFLQTTILLPLIDNYAASSFTSNVLYTFDNIHKLDNIKEPKFVFAHIVSPHPPYLFDENGEKVPTNIKLDNEWSEAERKLYLGQLKFINKKTMESIDAILNKSSNSIIILQSDHGTSFLGKDWEDPSDEFIQERSKILNAILLNNDSKKSLYPGISSVNTFRIVFNSVFNDNFELLGDSTYFSNYDNPYDFINVTDIVNGH